MPHITSLFLQYSLSKTPGFGGKQIQLGTEVDLIDGAADNELGISCSNDGEPEIGYIPVLSPSVMIKTMK